jgi:hypothetical protein
VDCLRLSIGTDLEEFVIILNFQRDLPGTLLCLGKVARTSSDVNKTMAFGVLTLTKTNFRTCAKQPR